jgi:hypothetical protein
VTFPGRANAEAQKIKEQEQLAPLLWPGGPRPVGAGLAENKRFALKGLEMRTRFGSKVGSRFSPYPGGGPFRANSGGKLTHGKPRAMLFWPLRATDWQSPNRRAPSGRMHERYTHTNPGLSYLGALGPYDPR